LGRRVIALLAAYVIAVSSLMASFGAARAAAESAAVPAGIICHTAVTGQTSPATGEPNGKICAQDCCFGCLTLTAALPPPPVKAVGALRSTGQVLAPPAIAVLVSGPTNKSSRSRAPPLPA
jgi:hypothetical protein